MLHSSLLQWHGLLRSIYVHGHLLRLLHCSLLLWHGLLLLLWPWLLLQLFHCSLLQCYGLLLQCSLLPVQCNLLLLPLAKRFNQMTEHWPWLHWLLLLFRS